MTLDEAIAHAENVGQGSCACAEDHRQLAEWLRELKLLHIKVELAEEIIQDISDYQCDRAEDNGGTCCPEILDEDDELLYDDPDDWCPPCRARSWMGISDVTDD